jgi:cold shock CspA family protein/ribosome-associated translation inhibitor RaiA
MKTAKQTDPEPRAGVPFDIAYRNVEPSESLEQHVLRGLARIEKIATDLVRLRVTVSRDNVRRRTGNHYQVRLDFTFPGRSVAITRTPPAHPQDETLTTAVTEAFSKAREELLEARQLRRGEVKAHEPVDLGRVTDLLPDYGFLEAADGHIVYFHRNSVLGAGFDSLTEGTQVRFVEERGEKGPQASTVAVVGKRAPKP